MDKIKTGIKLRVTPEQSMKVQEICFENGIGWGFTNTIARYIDEPFLFINKESLGWVGLSQEEFFNGDENEEVSAELFIRTNGTCVESEIITEDNNNNKGEQMAELKLECLVEGYEGTYFEIGQVWETRDEINKAKIIEIERDKGINYPIECQYYNKLREKYFIYNVDKYGKYTRFSKNRFDLFKLISTEATTESIPSEEPQPKTLSEYLKENNAYEIFVENCVEEFLKNLAWCKVFKSENKIISLGNTFIWEDTKEGQGYWHNLSKYKPKNLVYNMNEIIFAEVDRRIAKQDSKPEFISTEEFNQMLEQKATTKYMVFVEGRKAPKVIHETRDSAEKEAKRLSAKEIGCNVFVVEIIKEYKSKVIVEEVK